MDNIKARLTPTPPPPNKPKPTVQDGQQSRVDLPSSTSSFGLKISAEAQYLFEVDKYLFALDQTTQNNALDYLSNSGDLLQKKAAEYFIKAQEALGEDRTIVLDTTGLEQAGNLLDTGFELNGKTEIAVMPMATEVFRLDGNENFHPIKLNYRNDTLKYELDALEKTAQNVLDNQDAANLFGSVRNALSASENILLSFDDVLHFNYTIDKARAAVDFIDAPERIASALTELLNHSVAYQNDKQSWFLDDTEKLLNDSRVGQMASEDVRLGTAAQLYNNQLQRSLDATGLSVLDDHGAVTQLLSEHVDLVRFNPAKLDEALTFYETDFENFEKALNNEFGEPVESVRIELDGALLDVGRNYAERVIEGFENYLRK